VLFSAKKIFLPEIPCIKRKLFFFLNLFAQFGELNLKSELYLKNIYTAEKKNVIIP
jgi:hypothetical protein